MLRVSLGPLYIDPRDNRGRYDREIFLVLKEFSPTFSKGGDMAMDALAGDEIPALKALGAAADAAAQTKTKGYEVGYDLFSINGKMLGYGEPIRVRAGELMITSGPRYSRQRSRRGADVPVQSSQVSRPQDRRRALGKL